ncbi:MAG: Transcriptional regulator, TetR family protein [Myxococcales bacterium]|nr:Transcriptional regulator, TetR family protein [Myxococcales bacterium]
MRWNVADGPRDQTHERSALTATGRGATKYGMNVRSVNKRVQKPAAARGRGRPLVDDKRRRILDAALETFAERGYHGTAVPEVAQAAGVGTGTLYRYFENKEALVNEVYRDAKVRLRTALLDGVPDVDLYKLDMAERWFAELWRRLATFARAEPNAFRFLEMQDHAPYLDAESRNIELSLLAPLWLAGKRLREHLAGPPVDVLIALSWGAFVGIVKAGRLGYLRLDERTLEQAGAAAWRMIAPATSRAADSGLAHATPTAPRSARRAAAAPTDSRSAVRATATPTDSHSAPRASAASTNSRSAVRARAAPTDSRPTVRAPAASTASPSARRAPEPSTNSRSARRASTSAGTAVSSRSTRTKG